MLPLSSSLKASGHPSGLSFSELDRSNGSMNLTRHLYSRKISAHSERTIILAVIFGVLGSLALLGAIYYIGRRYLSRQSRTSPTDLIIERPIEISSPPKRDFPLSPAALPELAQPVFKPASRGDPTPFVIDHPYAHPYTVRNPTGMPMPQPTAGTASTTDSSSVGPISVQSMPHPYSSQQHPVLRRENAENANYSRPTYNNAQPRFTTTLAATDESQQYESFMTPETPRSLTSPETLESGMNTTGATRSGGSITIERRNETKIEGPVAAATSSTFNPVSPSSAYSNDTFPSMYSYTSTSGPIPSRELHSPQPLLQSHTQFQ